MRTCWPGWASGGPTWSPSAPRRPGAVACSGPSWTSATRPLLDILPLQQLALELALARGENPDAPRGLKKVTATM